MCFRRFSTSLKTNSSSFGLGLLIAILRLFGSYNMYVDPLTATTFGSMNTILYSPRLWGFTLDVMYPLFEF